MKKPKIIQFYIREFDYATSDGRYGLGNDGIIYYWDEGHKKWRKVTENNFSKEQQ
jgi:hypothetical protein